MFRQRDDPFDNGYSYGESPYGHTNSYGFGRRDYYGEMFHHITRYESRPRTVGIKFKKRY